MKHCKGILGHPPTQEINAHTLAESHRPLDRSKQLQLPALPMQCRSASPNERAASASFRLRVEAAPADGSVTAASHGWDDQARLADGTF